MYEFKMFTRINGEDFIILRDVYNHDNEKQIKLLDVEYINQSDIREFHLITKNKKYELFDNIEDMEKKILPDGFLWCKCIYKSEEVCDNHGCPMATWNYYKLILVKDKKKILLNNDKLLLQKLKKACEDF